MSSWYNFLHEDAALTIRSRTISFSILIICIHYLTLTCCELQVSLGFYDTCSLWLEEYKCWGQSSGNTAPPSDSYSFNDDFVPNQIISGYVHHCIISNHGKVRCWGDNEFGKLGYENTDDIAYGATLEDVDFGADFYVEGGGAGLYHSCFVSNQSEIKCIGRNSLGQLGYGDEEGRGDGIEEMGDALPSVDLGDGFVPIQLAVGGIHNCVLSTNSDIKCWGWGNYGQLGYGDFYNQGDDANDMGDNLPIVDLGNFLPIQLEAGYAHSCAISDEGSLKCWGRNSYGHLGLGDTGNRGGDAGEMGDFLPIINLGSNFVVRDLLCGQDHNCALSMEGYLKCFGRGNYGQLGYGSSDNVGDQFNEMGDYLDTVDLGSNFYALGLGAGPYAMHSCANSIDDDLKCWGWNYMYQLGLGDTNNRGDEENEMGNALQYVVTLTAEPTIYPTNHPTYSPSHLPSLAPSLSPTNCIDYFAKYYSNDGADIIDDESVPSIPSSSDYLNQNRSFIVYSNISDPLISCDRSAADICYIQCNTTNTRHSCSSSIVSPSTGVDLDEMIIACTERSSCMEMTVNINVSTGTAGIIQIFCVEHNSCEDMVFHMITKNTSTVAIHCNETTSCKDMMINMAGERTKDPHYLLFMEIFCYTDNACDGLTIITSDHSKDIALTLNMVRWSEDIVIHHLYAENVNVHCGSKGDRLYIPYDVDQLQNDDDLLYDARREYSSNRLPCEDITIYCSNNSDFDHQCHYEYDLNIDLQRLLNRSDSADCYWMDLGEVYLADCQGTCGDAMVYNEYPILFDLDHDLIFHGGNQYNYSNQTISYLICNEYFSMINDTASSLQSIEVIFKYVLDQIAAYSDIIHSVSFGPKTSLRNGVTVECTNSEINVVKISTNLTIKSAESDDTEIERIFAEDGDFITTATALLSNFFNIPITVIIVVENDINISEGFTPLQFGLMGGGVCVFCTCVLLLAAYIRYKKPMYIRNAMVISIGIGKYDVNKRDGRMQSINLFLEDLTDGVSADIASVIEFFDGNLKYDVFTQYNGSDESAHRVIWTKADLLTHLEKLAMRLQRNLLNENIPSYDGLVVFFSCHGLKDAIYTSDYQTMTRESIHRIFSSFAINRTIPRIFVFDCCAGNQSRDERTRSDIDLQQMNNGKHSSYNNSIPDHHPRNRANTQLRYMDSVMEARNEVMYSPIYNVTRCNILNLISIHHDLQENVDFKLVQIDGANPDYVAYMMNGAGSFLTRILIRSLREKPQNFLFENMMNVQKVLYDRSRTHGQLTKQCYFNGTEYIKFVVNKGTSPNSDGHPVPPKHIAATSETEEKRTEIELAAISNVKENFGLRSVIRRNTGSLSNHLRRHIGMNDDFQYNMVESPVASAEAEMDSPQVVVPDHVKRADSKIDQNKKSKMSTAIAAKVLKYEVIALIEQESVINDPEYQQMNMEYIKKRKERM